MRKNGQHTLVMSHEERKRRSERGWLTIKAAAIYSGLSTRLIQDYVREGLVLASHVTKPGASRGRTLVELASLDAFIREGVGGKAPLKMNLRRDGNRA